MALQCQAQVVLATPLGNKEPVGTQIARVFEFQLAFQGEVLGNAFDIGRKAAPVANRGKLADAAAHPQLRGDAADLPMRGRLVAGHIAEIVVEQRLLAGDEIGFHRREVRLVRCGGRGGLGGRRRLGCRHSPRPGRSTEQQGETQRKSADRHRWSSSWM